MAENDLSMSNMNVRVVTQELKQDPGTVHIKFNPFQTETEDTSIPPEPQVKKQRVQPISDTSGSSIKQQLFNINKAICLRLDSIESKLNAVFDKTKDLESKMEVLMSHFVTDSSPEDRGMMNGPIDAQANLQISEPNLSKPSSSIVVGVTQGPTHSPTSMGITSPGSSSDIIDKERYAIVAPGSSEASVHKLYQDNSKGISQNITLITLNSEEDYPNGSWLGDETNPEIRVRVPITSSDLLHIHSNCRTAEKMALTLLDYLFDRETQATSNLSGMGKHGKKQLDPLLIYGIRCHLIKRFNMTEQDWHRIKQNIDSKCRTAFRRKQRGLPLTVKAFRGKAPTVMNTMLSGYPQLHDLSSHSDDSLQHEDGEIQLTQVDHLDTGNDNMVMAPLTQINSNGEIQVLHATPEQVAQLQQTHQIQILQGDQVIGHLGGSAIASDIQVTVSLPSSESEALHMSTSSQHSPLMCPVDEAEDEMGIKQEPDVNAE